MSNPIANPRTHAPLPEAAPDERALADLRECFADLDNPYQRAFLAAFIVTRGVAHAAKLAGVERSAHYHWMKRDDGYCERFELAREMIADDAEAEIWRRAFQGVDTPLHWRGEITAWYKTYSDALAVFAMRALKPEAYRRTDPDFSNYGGPTGFDITIMREGDEKVGPPAPPTISIPVNEDPSTGSGQDPSTLRRFSGQAGSGQGEER